MGFTPKQQEMAAQHMSLEAEKNAFSAVSDNKTEEVYGGKRLKCDNGSPMYAFETRQLKQKCTNSLSFQSSRYGVSIQKSVFVLYGPKHA